MPQATHMYNTKGEEMGKVQSNISRKHKIIPNKRNNNRNILILKLKCYKKMSIWSTSCYCRMLIKCIKQKNNNNNKIDLCIYRL